MTLQRLRRGSPHHITRSGGGGSTPHQHHRGSGLSTLKYVYQELRSRGVEDKLFRSHVQAELCLVCELKPLLLMRHAHAHAADMRTGTPVFFISCSCNYFSKVRVDLNAHYPKLLVGVQDGCTRLFHHWGREPEGGWSRLRSASHIARHRQGSSFDRLG